MDTNEERIRRLGATIARLREQEGISQAVLTRMLGYSSHSHLSRIENGEKAPSIVALFNIADALDVDVKYFFTDL
ncbi:MAG: helix-turn-helix domain-containing protein [Coriobacteriaceae bacterium]|nr:helix-turn-helix domain-containing protein [Coriobacteriaceae bacterium]